MSNLDEGHKGLTGLINGQLVDVENIPPELFSDVESCAHALSQNNRYNGNTIFPYSVAQHSVVLSLSVPEHLEKAAMLHDMSEWVFGDLIRPIKRRFPLFDELETKCQKDIFEFYGVPWSRMGELHEYDLRICVDEMLVLCPKLPRSFLPPAEPIGTVTITEWSPTVAKRIFIDRFQGLFHDA